MIGRVTSTTARSPTSRPAVRRTSSSPAAKKTPTGHCESGDDNIDDGDHDDVDVKGGHC